MAYKSKFGELSLTTLLLDNLEGEQPCRSSPLLGAELAMPVLLTPTSPNAENIVFNAGDFESDDDVADISRLIDDLALSTTPSSDESTAFPPGDTRTREQLDEQRGQQRMRQVHLGKSTVGYQNYIKVIPKETRIKGTHLETPPTSPTMSKREWDKCLRKWRKGLHKYDTINPDGTTKAAPKRKKTGRARQGKAVPPSMMKAQRNFASSCSSRDEKDSPTSSGVGVVQYRDVLKQQMELVLQSQLLLQQAAMLPHLSMQYPMMPVHDDAFGYDL